MEALGLNELKNKFALTPSSQTSRSWFSLEVQLLPSILRTEGGPLAKFLGIVCPLMRGCLLNISPPHTWKLPTKINSFFWNPANKQQHDSQVYICHTFVQSQQRELCQGSHTWGKWRPSETYVGGWEEKWQELIWP